jgi:hypothetical protein
MKTEIINTIHITDSEKRQLYSLYEQFYTNTDYQRFLHDFNEKQWLIRMMDGERLIGFSTQQIISHTINNKPARFLFSGDTIVDPAFWNSSHLAGAFGHLFLHIIREDSSPLYWFLISKGFRTYRFLPIFFNNFYPAFTQENKTLKPVLDSIADLKFGNCYDPETELVTFPNKKEYLTESLAEIPQSRRKDPHINFFLKRNPNYREGTELACITPLSENNLTKCGNRVISTTEVNRRE